MGREEFGRNGIAEQQDKGRQNRREVTEYAGV